MYRNRPRPAPTALRPRHGGFTLIEIMVAVAILAILAALTVFGLRKVLHGTQTSATLVTLNNLRAMMDELEKATKLERDTGHWLAQVPAPYGNNAAIAVYKDSTATLDTTLVNYSPPIPINQLQLSFFRAPMRYPRAAGGQLISANAVAALPCPPGPVSTDYIGGHYRMAAVGVLNLQIALRLFASTPVARSAIAALPAGQLMVPDFVSVTDGGTYVNGNVVKVEYDFMGPKRTVFYRAIVDAPVGPPPAVTATSDPLPAAQNGWEATTNALSGGPAVTPEPVVLDAWHNPILYCPASGVIGVWTGGKPGKAGTVYHVQNPASPPALSAIPLPPGISSLTTGTFTFAGPIVAPDGRPFFASAGPDGDFTTGDDNVYSFEN